MSQIFISYSRKDAVMADKIVKALQDAGLDVWIDREDIRAGNSWRQQIVEAIDACQIFVLALSPNSAASDNVRKEIDLAQDSSRVMLPFLLAPTQVPAAIRYQLAGIQFIDAPTLGFDAALAQLADIVRHEIAKKKSSPSAHKTAEVVIEGVNLAAFDEDKQKQLLAFLAGLTQTDPSQIRIADLRAGSVHAFVEMPTRAACQLKTLALNHDRRLKRAKVYAVRLEGDTRLIPTFANNLPWLAFVFGLALFAALALWRFFPTRIPTPPPTPLPAQIFTPLTAATETSSPIASTETFALLPSQTPTEAPPELVTASRCDVFANLLVKYIMLVWEEGNPLTFYFQIPGGVPGLEAAAEGEWHYAATIDGRPTGECKYVGYKERLYCAINLPSSYSFTLQKLTLSVNECETPIYENPLAEIPKIKLRPSRGNGGTSTPDAIGPADIFTCDAPSWCSCVGGVPICPVP